MDRADRCSMCGTSESEWADDPFAYQPMLHTCIGCMKKELLAEDDTQKPKGTTVRLIPKGTAERLQAEQERRAAEGVSSVPRRRRNRG